MPVQATFLSPEEDAAFTEFLLGGVGMPKD